MEPSPLQLTEDQRQARDKKRIEDFTNEYKELCAKHKLVFKAVLNSTPAGLFPHFVVASYEPETEEVK